MLFLRRSRLVFCRIGKVVARGEQRNGGRSDRRQRTSSNCTARCSACERTAYRANLYTHIEPLRLSMRRGW
jgi:hypothetical protein